MIRKVTINDLDKISKLFDQYRVFYHKESDFESAKFFIKERIKNQDAEIFVAEKDGNIVGFVQLYPIFSSTRMKKHWLLNDLYVTENYRGKGISKELIEVSKNLCAKTDACGLLLETSKSNKIGNQLYPKTGFKLCDSVNFYEWENPENC